MTLTTTIPSAGTSVGAPLWLSLSGQSSIPRSVEAIWRHSCLHTGLTTQEFLLLGRYHRVDGRFMNIFFHNYSPNSLLTLRSTLSFSGSYGWSLLGISSIAGKASVKLSTLYRIFSATYMPVFVSPQRSVIEVPVHKGSQYWGCRRPSLNRRKVRCIHVGWWAIFQYLFDPSWIV